MSVSTAPTATTSTTHLPSTTRVPSGAVARRRSAAAILTALSTVLISLFTLAAPASAYTISSRSSVPVLPTIYAVEGAHHNTGSAVTGPMWRPYVYQAGPVVSRVSPSGTQHVKATYAVERWTGSAWTAETSQTVTGRIDATLVSVRLPALSQYVGGGSWYRVRLSITWTSPIGAVLGSLGVTMDGAGDYRCTTTQTCSVVTNAVHLR